MNKKKLLLISIPVVLGGVLLYFLTRGKGKGKQKEKEQKGDGTQTTTSTTTTSTSTGGGRLINNFPITIMCSQTLKDSDFKDTKIPDDWDLYVVSLNNKSTFAKLRQLWNYDNNPPSSVVEDAIKLPMAGYKGYYDYYHFYNNKDYQQYKRKDGDVFIASNNLRGNRFRKIYLRKLRADEFGSEKISDVGLYQIFDEFSCISPINYRNSIKDSNLYYMDKSLLKPLKEVDPERYQQELQVIKNQIANRKFIG